MQVEPAIAIGETTDVIQETGMRSIELAALRAVAYADVFDYPLTPLELHRYLIGVAASAEQIHELIQHPPAALSVSGTYISLAGREANQATRRERAHEAARMWPRALHYARTIAGIPFVRMVALTGALAMDNVEPGADIDYLIVTQPGRLWLCRLLIIGLVRLAAVRGDVICPNYLLSERALALSERDLYTAHELAQMVPLAGHAVYQRMRRLNAWSDAMLPNAADAPQRANDAPDRQPRAQALGETLLRGGAGAAIERWEMQRKLRKLGRSSGSEVAFSPDWCKGHVHGHGQRVLQEYARRIRSFS